MNASPAPLPRSSVKGFAILIGLLLLTLAWELSGLDLPVMRLLGHAGGFPLQHHWLLEAWLHDGLRKVFVLLYGLTLFWAWGPERCLGPLRGSAIPRRERTRVLALVTGCLLTINLVKRLSLTSCPWDLHEFGGVAAYIPHWNLWAADGGAGHCFPSGHASSALAFMALGLPWLLPPAGQTQRSAAWGWALVLGAGLLGLLLGGVQTLRGAHYPSHTLWTLLICWGGPISLWHAGLWRHARQRQAPHDDSPRPAALPAASD